MSEPAAVLRGCLVEMPESVRGFGQGVLGSGEVKISGSVDAAALLSQFPLAVTYFSAS